VLAERKIIEVAPVCGLAQIDHPWPHEYLMGKRARAGQPNPNGLYSIRTITCRD